MNQFNLAQQLEEAFNQVGTTMMPDDDFASKLLAFTYVLGGEVTVLHEGLNAAIAIAAQKFHIKGGEIPTLPPNFKNYCEELDLLESACPWITEIEKRYNLEPRKEKSLSKDVTAAVARIKYKRRITLEVSCDERNKICHLDKIEVPKELRGKGFGKEAMRKLTIILDCLKLDCMLTVDESYGSDPDRLIKFYNSFGFAEDMEDEVRGEMIRRINPLPAVIQKSLFR